MYTHVRKEKDLEYELVTGLDKSGFLVTSATLKSAEKKSFSPRNRLDFF
jgi:hypothetical protein